MDTISQNLIGILPYLNDWCWQITGKMIKDLEANKKFYLEEEFRNVLFKKAREKEGSLRQLGRKLGYTGPSPNYYVNRMWRGEQAIRIDQLKTLAKITNISLSTILKNSRKLSMYKNLIQCDKKFCV